MRLGLVKYDAMRLAIEQARDVDEVKEIRDKARALEVYAEQALDHDAERKVAEIRIRAERRCGEMIVEGQSTGLVASKGINGGDNKKRMSEQPTSASTSKRLSELGISRDQSSQWQKLAAIPKDEFEKAINTATEGPQGKPTTQGVIDAARGKKPPTPMPPPQDPVVLHAWGRIIDFEDVLDRSPSEIFAQMRDYQQEQVRDIAPRLATWLKEMIR